MLIIGCNIGLMFVNEPLQIDRAENQKTDEMIEEIRLFKYVNKNNSLVNRNSNWSGISFLKKMV